MIHKLKDPIRGATHAQVYRVTENIRGESVKVDAILGTLEDGKFVRDEMLVPMTVEIPARDVVGKAQERGGRAPDWRREDLVSILDAVGWRNPNNIEEADVEEEPEERDQAADGDPA